MKCCLYGKNYRMLKYILFLAFFIVLPVALKAQSEVLRWMDGKSGAVSVTFDGGTVNQFKVAMPILNEHNFKGTFYIVTGDVNDAEYRGEFIGRPLNEIVEETKEQKTNASNLFERSAALRYLESSQARLYHTRAGDLFELGRVDEACREIDIAYSKFIKGELKKDTPGNVYNNPDVDISWKELKEVAIQGHEIGNHSVTHPQLGIYDTPNMKYEIEKAKEEIETNLGAKNTFSGEIPHGIENPRVMDFAGRFIPVLRNRLALPYLDEINRWSRVTPYESGKHYIQWQRGPKSNTSLKQMKSWADTCLKYNNVWLVLTFHGIDQIGYEPVKSQDFRLFTEYLKENEDKLWIAPFRDVVKYMKERMASSVTQMVETGNVVGERTEISNREEVAERIVVGIRHNLDQELYNVPLTLKTYLPAGWSDATVVQEGNKLSHKTGVDKEGKFVIYSALPNRTPVLITRK
ncbi:MAG: polysaccharide deacetylase family protein [Bacteroidales bacterium]